MLDLDLCNRPKCWLRLVETMEGKEGDLEKRDLRSRGSAVNATAAVGARCPILIIVASAVFVLHLFVAGWIGIDEGLHKVVGELADVATACSSRTGGCWIEWQIRSSLILVHIKTREIIREQQLLIIA